MTVNAGSNVTLDATLIEMTTQSDRAVQVAEIREGMTIAEVEAGPRFPGSQNRLSRLHHLYLQVGLGVAVVFTGGKVTKTARIEKDLTRLVLFG